ncbi:MAG: TIGR03067 domain-containing protein [Steroidobacteraceae bacterium]
MIPDGEWRPIAAYVDGQVLPVHELRVAELSMHDGRYQILDGSRSLLDEGCYDLGDDAKLRPIDLRIDKGPHAGRRLRGIFACEQDLLTICYDLDGGERPTSFEPREELLLLQITYARVLRGVH